MSPQRTWKRNNNTLKCSIQVSVGGEVLHIFKIVLLTYVLEPFVGHTHNTYPANMLRSYVSQQTRRAIPQSLSSIQWKFETQRFSH